MQVYNAGKITASDVPQLYVGIPGGPAKQLRGFEKVSLGASASVQVTFELTRKDLSVWDTVAQDWLLPSGTYDVHVGRSSRDVLLTGTLTI